MTIAIPDHYHPGQARLKGSRLCPKVHEPRRSHLGVPAAAQGPLREHLPRPSACRRVSTQFAGAQSCWNRS
eukprot:1145175-Pelagomonas_calceolata.AAC.2